MSSKEQPVETLERGHIYFLYRPRVEREEPRGRKDLQNMYMVLSPQGKQLYRLIIVGREQLPDVSRGGHARFWAFVDRVSRNPRDLVTELGATRYETKTRGERHQPAARPAGEGVYRIVRHGDHTHLVYALELPAEPGEVQDELNIEPEASYIVTVKNPSRSSPPGAGLAKDAAAHFPEELAARFRGRAFAELDPPDFLDHEGAELILIAAAADVKDDLGIELEPKDEDESSADIFRDLRLRKSEQPIGPLTEGRWE